jgi:hypothetical protein
VSRSVALTRAGVGAPIHTWVLAILVALCLAFGLSPFFVDDEGEDAGTRPPAADIASQEPVSAD